jgi:hypothetical protein
MTLRKFARNVLFGLLILTGIAAGAADLSKPAQPDSNPILLYVGFKNAQKVLIYQNGHNSGPIGELVDGLANITGGMAVDQDQDVYATASPGWVVAYPRGGVVPGLRYQFPDQQQPTLVAGITVDPAGTLYASLVGDLGIVAEYTKGNTTKASFTISPPSPYSAFAVAVDSQNNLYIEYALNSFFPQTAYIEKCPPQSQQCTDLGVSLGAGGTSLAVDSQGNVVACDDLGAQIDVFPANGGNPRVISQGLTGCSSFALDHSEHYLAVGNQSHNGGAASISIFNYATGAPIENITAGIPPNDTLVSLALSPAQP